MGHTVDCQERFQAVGVINGTRVPFGKDIRIIPVELAIRIGMVPAMLVSQIDYWLKRSGKMIMGRRWIYNTYDDWVGQFPFLSKRTIQWIFLNLEEAGIIESTNLNRSRVDKTKWYTLNYRRLDELFLQTP
jgi:hypothetical protein